MKSIKIILILSIISIVILACGDNENPVIKPVVAPEPKPIKPNLSAPVIKKIVVPDQVRASTRRIILEAVAEDADGNTLTYNWEAPAGKLLYTKTMSIAIWTAPIDLGVVTVTVTVNDGIHESTQSADVRVIPALIMPGKEAAGIRLGDKLYEVIDLYGEPNNQLEVNELDGAAHFIEWETRYNWDNAGLTLYFRNNRVYEIEIGDPNTATTAEGIGIGSDFDEANRKLGPYNGGGNQGDERRQYQAYRWDHKGLEIRRVGSIVKWIVIRKPQK